MKTEQEFLISMWQTVSDIEFEERQKEIAKLKNRQLIKQTILIYGSMLVVFVFLILGLRSFSLLLNYSYSICLVAIACGYFTDSFFLARHKNRRAYLESRN